MSYQEKRTIATMISGLLILVAYGIYVNAKFQEGTINFDSDLMFWASTMLIFIVVGIVVMIVIQIIYHIMTAVVAEIKNEEMEDTNVEDEMDKLIMLKSERNASIIAGVGFVTALIAIMLGKSAPVMMNIIFISYLIGTLIEGASQLYFYRKGI